NDHALAPVVAVMLILAIGVTVFAVYNSTYLPGLKEQAEVEHMKEVESGFAKFSSDIDNAIASGKSDIIYSEQIPLGGGDILVNSMKSSGTIRVRNESLGILYINYSTGSSVPISLSLVNISYEPLGNYWLNQSYIWQEGYVNVVKNDLKRSTPLQYDNGTIDDTYFQRDLNQFSEDLISPSGTTPTNITLQIIRIIAGTNNITSSNGIAKLSLKTDSYYLIPTDNPIQNVTDISFNQIETDPGLDSGFVDDINDSIPHFSPPNNVSVRIIEITVGVN
ncbi:MAG TPA: hypothetical protein VMC42_10230, partial [Methanoregulaceae archaeon]|nr:hypothetical protein [Methanoregulaceae archaeon]